MDATTMTRHPTLALTLLLLAGCGGGSIDGDGGGGDAGVAEGTYDGNTEDGRATYGIVLGDDRYWMLYTVAGDDSTIAGFVQGSGDSDDGIFRSTDLRDFSLEAGGVAEADLEASYDQGHFLDGVLDYGSFGTLSFESTYDDLWEGSPSLSAIAGYYQGQLGSTVGSEPAELLIAANGTLSGYSLVSGCEFDGGIAARSDGNAYDLTIAFGPACASLPPINGVAIYVPDSQGLLATLVDVPRTLGMVFVGSK